MHDVYTIDELEAQADRLPVPRLGVVGNPIAHSLSPAMHLAAMRAAGIPGAYVRILCSKEEGAFGTLIERLRRIGFLGVNVTVPFKYEARLVADEVDQLSELSGAVNTLVFREKGIEGYNTDGPGFVHALEEKEGRDNPLSSAGVLVLGACGGAGSALAIQCALAGCRALILANRPRPELARLASKLRAMNPALTVTTCPLNDEAQMAKAAHSVDLIVNATSLGLSSRDPLPIAAEVLSTGYIQPSERTEAPLGGGGCSSPGRTLFDLITHATPLQKIAEEKRYVVINGREMLVQQGALSFEKWFGKTADAAAMRAAISE